MSILRSGVSILLAGLLTRFVASWKRKWGKHPACRVVDAVRRKLEAYATGSSRHGYTDARSEDWQKHWQRWWYL